MTKLETQLYTALRALLDADIEIGEDEGDDSVFDVAHDATTAYERAEVAAAEYRQKNPLGGPAKMFEAAASRIRAGEPLEYVLEDYGLRFEQANDQVQP